MELFLFFVLGCVAQVSASNYYSDSNNYTPSPYTPSHIGKCNQNDGFYYLNDGSFMICTNGAAYMQPCAPGTQNAPAQAYSTGLYASQAVFCGVNLISQHYLNYYGIDPNAGSGYPQNTPQNSYSHQPKPSYSAPAYDPPSYPPKPQYSAPTSYSQPPSYSPPRANQKPPTGYPSISIAYKPVVSYSKPAQSSSQTSYPMAHPRMMPRYPKSPAPAKPSYRPAMSYARMPAYLMPYLARYQSGGNQKQK